MGEFGRREEGGQETTTMKMIIERIPCYMTTIIFRGLALTLTISFLREFSPISIIILFTEVVVVSVIRIMKSEGDKEEKAVSFGILVATNLGSMNAYANGADASRIDEDVKNVASFIKTLAIITTIHHCVVLIFILT